MTRRTTKHPLFCPFCGSDNLDDHDLFRSGLDDTQVILQAMCTTCEREILFRFNLYDHEELVFNEDVRYDDNADFDEGDD